MADATFDDQCRVLRKYQTENILKFERYHDLGHQAILFEQPTGSGKTLEIVTILARNLGVRFTHALVAAPQNQIEAEFVHRAYDQIRPGPDSPMIAAPADLIARAPDGGRGRAIAEYLGIAGAQGYAVACTHQALGHVRLADLPADLSECALFLDEGHHSQAAGLRRFIDEWQARGGQFYSFTATAYRTDGQDVCAGVTKVVRRSLAQHMADTDAAGNAYAPRHVRSAVIALGESDAGVEITAGQWTGETLPPETYQEKLIERLYTEWVQDESPKTIIRVPTMTGGCAEFVAALSARFKAGGTRVLDASGLGKVKQREVIKRLRQEQRCKLYAQSEIGVIVGVQRIKEGTDWPVCSHVYSIGMPGSLQVTMQLLGRATRLKHHSDYPAKHRETACIKCFVPCAAADLNNLALCHSRYALLLATVMADAEVGNEWLVHQLARTGVRREPEPTDPHELSAADFEDVLGEAVAPEVRSQVEFALTEAREQLVNAGTPITLGGLMGLARGLIGDVPAEVVNRVGVEVLAGDEGEVGVAARSLIERLGTRAVRRARSRVGAGWNRDPAIRREMRAMFRVIVREFRDKTLEGLRLLDAVGAQVHGISGRTAVEFAQRFRDAFAPPLTTAQLAEWATRWHAEHNKWPGIHAGEFEGDGRTENWEAINTALKNGTRGLPGGSSLTKLLASACGVKNWCNTPDLTYTQLVEWATRWHAEHNEWPGVKSGAFEGDGHTENWSAINSALINGVRGLPGGSSLPKLLASACGVENRSDRPDLTYEQLARWATRWHAEHNKWPGKKSGAFEGDGRTENWGAINTALRNGNRGLPGGSSLSKLVKAIYGQ